VDPRYFRPTEVDFLVGDSTRARQRLGWQCSVSLDELVHEMVVADLATVEREQARAPHG
jgi:GDPmannose 4,6-dehydratase